MFTVPKSLLSEWSDYQLAAQDTELVLESYLDGVEELVRLPIDLESVNEEGVRSAATFKMVSRAMETLRAWCVSHGRYYHNVAVRQTVDFEECDLVCTPIVPNSGAGPSVSRLRDPMPWTKNELKLDAAVIIDAPLLVSDRVGYLADFLLSIQRPRDIRLRLEVSLDLLTEVSKFCRSSQHPFCRTVGIYTEQGGPPRIKVLQFLLRMPRPQSLDWPLKLVEEANTAAYGPKVDMENDRGKLLSAVETLLTAVRTEKPGIEDSDIAERYGGDLVHKLGIVAKDELQHVTYQENEPYEGDEAFWNSLATLLSGWREEFQLSSPEIHALLAHFDRAYDEAWKVATSKLALTGEIRFTPAVMSGIRARIGALLEKTLNDDPTGRAAAASGSKSFPR